MALSSDAIGRKKKIIIIIIILHQQALALVDATDYGDGDTPTAYALGRMLTQFVDPITDFEEGEWSEGQAGVMSAALDIYDGYVNGTPDADDLASFQGSLGSAIAAMNE